MGQSSFRKYLNDANLDGTVWLGKVVDNKDPEFMGRCKVRVYGKFDEPADALDHTKNFIISDENLPWAYPTGSSIFAGGDSKGAGSLSVPKEGTDVKIVFSSGNIYAPEYTTVQNVNDKLIDEIKDSYQNSHVLFFDEDEDVRILYTPERGIEMFHKDSRIIINPDSSITIEHKETKSIIELNGGTINITANSTVNITSNSKISSESTECILNGSSSTKLGPSPTYSGVLGEPLWAFLKIMSSAIDAKLPSTPGVITSQAASFEQLSLSKNVKLSR